MNSSLNRQIEILLIEDNPGDVRLTEEVLKEGKIFSRLSVVEDGVQAIDFLHHQGGFARVPRPDLILLDLNLPRKSGREVLEEIKLSSDFRRIPVVVLTTSQSEDDILRAYDFHANCYITKPIDLEQFIRVVRSIEAFWLTTVKLPPE
ncbi:response regulator [Leptolyngbya sp. FACHB-17]|uniref:response regulator n=1 Tax=unclassified Leptolyngbya TaxID=2650499 RepID=UPI001680B4A6|nr:response regulator [Leptolyngbya sp. FACHB-17]MBD2083015.1 response regulator [Leptolyngbya sp. FACHB-17]